MVRAWGGSGTSASSVTGPAVAGLVVYREPEAGRGYMIGADSAEGNPTSDDSVGCVVDAQTWEQVAVLAGKIEPGMFAQQLAQVARWYNGAAVLVERQNHGHATLRGLQALGDVTVALGLDGKPGWNSSEQGKLLMYDLGAEALQSGTCRVACAETRRQLADIENNTLRAPAGLHDDYADAFVLALAGCRYGMVSSLA